jgi:hypothetical protein
LFMLFDSKMMSVSEVSFLHIIAFFVMLVNAYTFCFSGGLIDKRWGV